MAISIYINQGFDETTAIGRTNRYCIRCSQCSATVINGLACHEKGCPNETYECRGCNAQLDYHGYCQDCQ